MKKQIAVLLLAGLLFSGCLPRLPSPEIEKKAPQTPPPVSFQDPVQGKVSFPEALARTFRHQFRSSLGRMEAAAGSARLEGDSGQLYKQAEAAGYSSSGGEGDRYFHAAAKADSFEEGGNRRRGPGEWGRAWDTLDFALSAGAVQGGGVSEDDRRFLRQKVWQNLILETRTVFYRAASAEALLVRTNGLLEAAGELLERYRKTYEGVPRPPRNALEEQRKLIGTVRFLWELTRGMSEARAELGVVMGLGPGVSYKIAVPDWNRPDAIPVKKVMAGIEHLALTRRQEFDSISASERTGPGVYETRRTLQEHWPGLPFEAPYDRRTVTGSDAAWLDAAEGLAGELTGGAFGLSGGDGALLSRAVVVQLHLACQRLIAAGEEYRLAQMLGEVGDKLISPAAAIIESPPAEAFARIQEAVKGVASLMRFHLAYAELENAIDRFYHSLGLNPVPENPLSLNLRELTGAVGRVLDARSERLEEAQAPFYPDAEQDFPASASSVPAPSPVGKSASEPESVSVSEAAAPSPSPPPPPPAPVKKTKEYDVNTAREAGRKPVKEVTVFRDVVNIHAAPSRKSPVKGQGLIGERYRLLGWAPNGWLKIEMSDGTPGWIPTKYIRPVEPPSDRIAENEKPSPEASEPPAPALRRTVVETTTRTNVRTGPGLDAPVIYIESPGVRFEVLEEEGEWFKIRPKRGAFGWVHDSVVKKKAVP